MSGGTAGTSNYQGFENVYFIIVILILLLQLRRRRVSLVGLVIMPLFILLFTLPVVMPELSSGPLGIALLTIGFIIGAGIGIAIGSMMEVKVDEKDGSMVLKGSILAVVLWAAIIGLRIYGKDLLGSSGLIDMNLLTSASLMMVIGMMIFRRGYVYWRYLKMKEAMPAEPGKQLN